MQNRFDQTLPPGWGAVTLLPAPRRRRHWRRFLVAAVAAAGAIAWALHLH